MDQNGSQKISQSEEIYISDILLKFSAGIRYLRSKWLVILIAGVLGGTIGLLYSLSKKHTFTAVCTFVLEDAKSNGMGQYAGLASLAGINIEANGGGIFEGDNILELYKSRIMIEKTLLTPSNFEGKNELLIDRFIDQYKFRDAWKDDNKLRHIKFSGDADKFDRKQDSIITYLADLFNKSVLIVTKPDKKLSIINVEVTTQDELFSKYFTEKLVENVNDFYIQTKTKKASQNVKILQRQVDSVKRILDYSINGVASAIDASPNANPEMSTLRVSSQKKQVDVQANTAIYSEVVKNLELEKIALRQEMPLIQVIDKPVLPLKINKIGKLLAMVFGGMVSGFLVIVFLIIRKILRSALQRTRNN